MNYHIVKVTSYYKDFLSYYYNKYPEIKNQSYLQQHEHLMKQRFAWSDAYAVAFSSMGHQAHEIVANAQALQRQWSKENSCPANDEKSILMAQLKKHKPEVLWFQDSYSFNGAFVKRIKKEIPSIKLVIGNCCSPISPHYYNDFKAFDFITVCAPYFKTLLEQNGLPESIIVPHAFDARILKEVNTPFNQNHDFLFSGSLILDQNFHKARIRFLESLIKDQVDINLLVNLNENSSKGLRLRQSAYIISKSLNKIGLNSVVKRINKLNKVNKLQYYPTSSKISKALKSQIKNPVFGIDMFKQLAESKITFNIHGDIAANFAANMRMYEATGMGSCLLTDWKPDINNYFIDEEEIITYKSLEEAQEKIKHLINNPHELEQIRIKGQQKTLRDHTFANRALIIDNKIKQKLS